MSARARADVAKLRQKYARNFQLRFEDVDTLELRNDWVVFAPKHPELPEWSLGYNN